MLDVREISSGYDGVTVIKEVSFAVGHEIFAVLGANGAGKTTLLATLARLLPLSGGQITLDGRDISQERPWTAAKLGLAYVPQEKGIFPEMTVLENLEIGGMFGDRPVSDRVDEMMALFPLLQERRKQRAGTLSGGESRMVACARALMQDPKVLLLDEPTAGLSPLYVDTFFAKIREIHRDRNVAIVLAEQNATMALEVADRVMVLGLGELVSITNADEVTTESLKEGYRI
jgi:branched-chain amino acid transport system ATP-binding protein